MPRPLLRWALRGLVVLALMVVFVAYLNPQLTVDLANRIWACF